MKAFHPMLGSDQHCCQRREGTAANCGWYHNLDRYDLLVSACDYFSYK